jgi:predicted SAM-dependent methyltransferase
MNSQNIIKESSLFQLFVFEITSWIGRNFKKKKNKIKQNGNETLLLDLGVGVNYTDFWINADFFAMPRLKFWKKYDQRPKIDLELDLRYPIPCDDNMIDGVYSGHTLEHLTMNEAISLLKETYRILKPGCWLRINVPDLEKYIEFYCGKTPNKEFMIYSTGCEAIHSLTQEWGHKSCWDNKFLSKTLTKIGFINVKQVEFGIEGTDKRLIKEEKVREWETLVLEAQKSLT